MGKSAGYDERFRVVLEAQLGLVAKAPAHAGDEVDVHDRGAVDLPEAVRVELFEQLPDGLADEGLAIAGDHARVLLVGLEEEHLLDRYEAHLRSHRGANPLEV